MFGRKRRQRAAALAAEKGAQARKKAERKRYWTDRFDQAEAGDAQAQREIIQRFPKEGQLWEYPSLQPRYSNVYNLYWTAWLHSEVRHLLAESEVASDLDKKIETLKALLVFRDKQRHTPGVKTAQGELGFTWKDLKERLQEAVRARYEELLEKKEEPEEFAKLWDLITQTRPIYGRSGRSDLWKLEVRNLPYPDEWNDLVAEHYDTPAIGAFLGLPERGAGDVRLLAAEALRTNNFTQAQIALAYCNSNPDVRAAVGDLLTAQLGMLVERRRAGVVSHAGYNWEY